MSVSAPVIAEAGGPDERSTAARAVTGGSVYVVLTLLRRALPLMLLPVFSASLTPAEFGEIALLVAMTAALSAVLGLGLEASVARNYVQLARDPSRQRIFVNTAGIFAVSVPLVGSFVAAVGLATMPSLAALVPDLGVVLIAFVGAAFQTSCTVFIAAILRAQERLRAYAVLSLLQGLGSPLLAVILVVVLDFGVFGWFVSALVASTVSLLAGLPLLRHRWTTKLSRSVVVGTIAFGIPLLPHALSHWALNLSDRVILAGSVGAPDLGVYNLAYQLASPIGLILVALRQGLVPIYAAAHDDARLRTEIGHLTTLQVHLTGLLGLAVAVLGPSAVWLAFPATYRGGGEFIPWIALGYVLFGFYLIPVDSLSLMLGRTRLIWLPTLIAAGTNVGLNLLLVPVLGALAAAINTAVAYGALLLGIVVLRSLERGPRIPYDLPRMILGLAVVAVAGGIAMLAAPEWDRGEAVVIRGLAVLAAATLILAYDRRWWAATRSELSDA